MVNLNDLLPVLLLGGERHLQFQLPDYTSPPLEVALEATPALFRNDTFFNQTRDMIDIDGTCNDNVTGCQILFPPPAEAIESGTAKIGVLFYGGALVDPRSYSVIAKTLSDVYGFAVAVPIFPNDVAYLGCSGTNRIPFAASAFPDVEKWLLVGHSMGGIGAQVDLWNAMNETDHGSLGGLVLLGSYIRPDLGCGAIDFSQTNIPMASAFGLLDGIVNRTNYDLGQNFLPVNDTFFLDVMGGNHGNFGHYDYSLRKTILFQFDGDALIPRDVQIDLTIGAIVHAASRMGVPLPSFTKSTTVTTICDENEQKSEDSDMSKQPQLSSGSSSRLLWYGYGFITVALGTVFAAF